LLSRTESPVTRQQLRPELYPNLLAKSLADLLPKLE
jgi:DNA-binding transcriptional regulator YdaS (Cro superfamily)